MPLCSTDVGLGPVGEAEGIGARIRLDDVLGEGGEGGGRGCVGEGDGDRAVEQSGRGGVEVGGSLRGGLADGAVGVVDEDGVSRRGKSRHERNRWDEETPKMGQQKVLMTLSSAKSTSCATETIRPIQ
jgi:hypothetical protein